MINSDFVKEVLSNNLKDKLKNYLPFILSSVPIDRIKPSFVIGGIQKGGTTSLFHYLIQHPLIKSPLHKELHFFTVKWDYGYKWYKGNFPIAFKDEYISGEATPKYLYSKNAAERIYAFSENIKMIFLLRHPVERAYSDYQYGVKLNIYKHKTLLSFEERVENELNWLSTNIDDLRSNKKDFYKDILKNAPYLGPGLYDIWLENWFKLFEKKNILVIKSEDFFETPQNTLNTVFDFLEVDRLTIKDLSPRNVNKYSKIDRVTQNKLTNFYEKTFINLQKIGIEYN